MKYLALVAMISLSIAIANAQSLTSVVEGRLEVYLPEDTSSMYIGKNAGSSIQPGLRGNTFIGFNAGSGSMLGDSNTIVGSSAGRFNSGNSNTFLGSATGILNKGDLNSFFGNNSGSKNSTGSGNSFLGTGSGGRITTGSNNICIGIKAGPAAADSAMSNRLYIDVSETSDPLLYAEFDNDLVRINGALELTGALSFKSSAEVLNSSPELITVDNRGYIRISTFENRTILLSNGSRQGQLLILESSSLANLEWTLEDSGNVNLGGDRTLRNGDTLQLLWNGSKWLELQFSNN